MLTAAALVSLAHIGYMGEMCWVMNMGDAQSSRKPGAVGPGSLLCFVGDEGDLRFSR